MGCAAGASETTDTSSSQLARRRTLTQSRSRSASSVKLKGAMLKMNSACIIQWAAIDPHLFNVGGRIGGNESRVTLDEAPSFGGLGHLLCRPVRQSTRLRLQLQLLVNSSGHVLHSPSCGQEHEKRTAEWRDGSVSFRSITAGPALTTAAWRTGIDSASYRWRSFVAARLLEACTSARRSVRAESLSWTPDLGPLAKV
jgi:hypothetical protein